MFCFTLRFPPFFFSFETRLICITWGCDCVRGRPFHAIHGIISLCLLPCNRPYLHVSTYIFSQTQACAALSLTGLPFAVATALESDLEPFHKLKRFVLRPSVSHLSVFFLRIYRFRESLHSCLSPLFSSLPPHFPVRPSTSLALPPC